jgi:hypothetical protein
MTIGESGLEPIPEAAADADASRGNKFAMVTDVTKEAAWKKRSRLFKFIPASEDDDEFSSIEEFSSIFVGLACNATGTGGAWVRTPW